MKRFIFLTVILILFACNDQNELGADEKIKEPTTEGTSGAKENPLSALHPFNLSPDQSWLIDLNIEGGQLVSYTVQYQSGESVTKEMDKSLPVFGGLDHPSGEFIDNNTYQIPNIGVSKKGYYEMQIFKDASCKYIEHETNLK